MSFSIEAITEVEDEYLGQWLEQRLDTTMGPCPQEGMAVSTTQRDPTTASLPHTTLAADIGKGVALGLKALGGSLATGQMTSTTAIAMQRYATQTMILRQSWASRTYTGGIKSRKTQNETGSPSVVGRYQG
jgi:hypothetical protein